jgi:hypothetical protein
MKAMESAVQSGDMAGAQQALAAMQTDTQNLQSALGGGAGEDGSNPYQSSVRTDLTRLVVAAQSGNMGTQTSLTIDIELGGDTPSFADNMQGGGAAGQSSSSTPQDPFLSDLQSLISAVQSGDMSGAKTAATALQNDMQQAAGAGGHHHHHHGGGRTTSSSGASSAQDALFAPNSTDTGASDGSTTDPLTVLLAAVSGGTSTSGTASSTNPNPDAAS